MAAKSAKNARNAANRKSGKIAKIASFPISLTNGSPSAANPDFLIGIGFEEQKEREEQKETTGP
jgi:hypothetical protein